MSAIKAGWGFRIALLYGGFVVFMVTLVTLSMKQDFQLVSKDYYDQELQYQQVIDAGKNQSALSAPVHLEKTDTEVRLTLPPEFEQAAVKGTVSFYAQANAAWDARFELEPVSNMQRIPRAQLHPTNYKVKISWEAAGRNYYQETALNLYN